MDTKDINFKNFNMDGPNMDGSVPLDPNNPFEVRIRELINSAEQYDRGSLLYEVSQLVAATINPSSTKRKWLSDLYERKGWIDSENASRLMEINVDAALSELEEVCLKKANLRSEGTNISRYRLAPPGEELGEHVRQTLRNNGTNPERLKVRYLWKPERIQTAIRTGSDRDFNSIRNSNHHGGYDGEELAMIRYGITSAADTLYLANLNNWKSRDNQDKFAVLVYSPDALEGIGPCGTMKSNGFHAFHFDGEVKKRSLLAIFER